MKWLPVFFPSGGIHRGALFDGILNPLRHCGSLNPEVSADLEHIINKALEKDRNVRYQSAAEIRADLRRLKRDTTSGRISAAQPAARIRSSRLLWIVGALAIWRSPRWVFISLYLVQRRRLPGSTRITNDGFSKSNYLFTDRTRLFFNELVNGRQAIVQVSTAGGRPQLSPVLWGTLLSQVRCPQIILHCWAVLLTALCPRHPYGFFRCRQELRGELGT